MKEKRNKRLLHHLINAAIWLFLLGGLAYYVFEDSAPANYLSIFSREPAAETSSQTVAGNGENGSMEETENQAEPTAALNSEMKIEALESLPNKVINPAPFVPQAPYQVWDDLHEEACEEAAIITARAYLDGQKSVSKEEADQEIRKLVAFQEEHFNGHHDLSVAKMLELIQGYYGQDLARHFETKTNYTETDLKKYLAEGAVIIVPAAGRVLENPNFKQPGPLYHALVIIGYDEKKQQFITSDPGTRKGEEFRYSYSNLMESIHDFPGQKDQILTGEKRVILVWK